MTFKSKFLHYSISWKKSAEKDLKSVPRHYARNIQSKIKKIAEDDPTLDIKKLQGYFDIPTYRLRVGDYRIIFEAHEHTIIILIVAIKHRKDAY